MRHVFVTERTSAEEIRRRVVMKIEKRPGGHFTECWLWTGKTGSNGYGRLRVPGTRKEGAAHRASYEAHVGPIPAGLDLDHLCRNVKCVNPHHLEPVTRSENVRRGDAPSIGAFYGRLRQRAKTHCPRGHPYDDVNTRISKRGARLCRACGRIHTRKWREKAEAA